MSCVLTGEIAPATSPSLQPWKDDEPKGRREARRGGAVGLIMAAYHMDRAAAGAEVAEVTGPEG